MLVFLLFVQVQVIFACQSTSSVVASRKQVPTVSREALMDLAFQYQLYVTRDDGFPIHWSDNYLNFSSPQFQGFSSKFIHGISDVFQTVNLSRILERVSLDRVEYPGNVNPSWSHGVFTTFSVVLTEAVPELNKFSLWVLMLEAIHKNYDEIGHSGLFISEFQIEESCLDNDCFLKSNCISLSKTEFTCQCPVHHKDLNRLKPGRKCLLIYEEFKYFLHVTRENSTRLLWDDAYLHSTPKKAEFVNKFMKGIYGLGTNSPILNYIANATVIMLHDPVHWNNSLHHGIVVEFSIGVIGNLIGYDDLEALMFLSIETNNFEIGNSDLYIQDKYSKQQPKNSCMENDCDQNAICIVHSQNGYTCQCLDNYDDIDAQNPGRSCQLIFKEFRYFLYVNRDINSALLWTHQYMYHGQIRDQFSIRFLDGLTDIIKESGIKNVARNASVINLQNPTLRNSTWKTGIFVEFTVGLAGKTVSFSDTWKFIFDGIRENDYEVGNSGLFISTFQYDPKGGCMHKNCRKHTHNFFETGYEVRNPQNNVEEFNYYIYALRDGAKILRWRKSWTDFDSYETKMFRSRFLSGIRSSFNRTNQLHRQVKNISIVNFAEPGTKNATWDTGIYVQFAVEVTGIGSTSGEVWEKLMETIRSNNNKLIGSSILVSSFQYHPNGKCKTNDCFPGGICYEIWEKESYKCICPINWFDKDLDNMGHNCRPIYGYNECLHVEDNDCEDRATCMNLDYLFECKCQEGMRDRPGKKQGTDCSLYGV